MDERQMQVRGRIGFFACIGCVVYALSAALLYDVGVLDISKIGFSDFMIASAILLVTALSLPIIWKDAYFGIHSAQQMKTIGMIFFALAILEDALFLYDRIRGDVIGVVSIASVCMVNSIAFSLWYKRKEYQRGERKKKNEAK